MRRVVICASLLLAMVQMWPLVFGGSGDGASQGPRFVPAAHAAVRPLASTASGAVQFAQYGMPTCHQRYARAYARCEASAAGCQLRASDNWDVCEATGFWPE